MLATSFYRRIQGGFYEPAFTFESWARLFSDFYLGRTLFSLRTCCRGRAHHRGRLPVHVVPHPHARRAQVPAARAHPGGAHAVRGHRRLQLGPDPGAVVGHHQHPGVAGAHVRAQGVHPRLLVGGRRPELHRVPLRGAEAVPLAQPGRPRADRGGRDAGRHAAAHVHHRGDPAVPAGAAGRVPAGLRVHPGELHHRPGAGPARALDAVGLHLRPGHVQLQRAVRLGHRHVPDRHQPGGGRRCVIRRVAIVVAPGRRDGDRRAPRGRARRRRRGGRRSRPCASPWSASWWCS